MAKDVDYVSRIGYLLSEVDYLLVRQMQLYNYQPECVIGRARELGYEDVADRMQVKRSIALRVRGEVTTREECLLDAYLDELRQLGISYGF